MPKATKNDKSPIKQLNHTIMPFTILKNLVCVVNFLLEYNRVAREQFRSMTCTEKYHYTCRGYKFRQQQK